MISSSMAVFSFWVHSFGQTNKLLLGPKTVPRCELIKWRQQRNHHVAAMSCQQATKGPPHRHWLCAWSCPFHSLDVWCTTAAAPELHRWPCQWPEPGGWIPIPMKKWVPNATPPVYQMTVGYGSFKRWCKNIWLTFEHHMNYQGSPIHLISPCPPAGSTPIHPQYPSNSGFSHIFIGCTSILASPIEHIWTSCFTGQWKLSCNWKLPNRFTVSPFHFLMAPAAGVLVSTAVSAPASRGAASAEAAPQLPCTAGMPCRDVPWPLAQKCRLNWGRWPKKSPVKMRL